MSSTMVVKRGRGRPRKDASRNTNTASKVDATTTSAASPNTPQAKRPGIAPADPAVKKKRPRGRPRKNAPPVAKRPASVDASRASPVAQKTRTMQAKITAFLKREAVKPVADITPERDSVAAPTTEGSYTRPMSGGPLQLESNVVGSTSHRDQCDAAANALQETTIQEPLNRSVVLPSPFNASQPRPPAWRYTSQTAAPGPSSCAPEELRFKSEQGPLNRPVVSSPPQHTRNTSTPVTCSCNSMEYRFTFGEHKGKTFEETPFGYLKALPKTECFKSLPGLKQAYDGFLKAQEEGSPPQNLHHATPCPLHGQPAPLPTHNLQHTAPRPGPGQAAPPPPPILSELPPQPQRISQTPCRELMHMFRKVQMGHVKHRIHPKEALTYHYPGTSMGIYDDSNGPPPPGRPIPTAPRAQGNDAAPTANGNASLPALSKAARKRRARKERQAAEAAAALHTLPPSNAPQGGMTLQTPPPSPSAPFGIGIKTEPTEPEAWSTVPLPMSALHRNAPWNH